MAILCGQYQGVVCSATRIVSFGSPSQDFQKRHDAVSRIDAIAIANTVTGAEEKLIFKAIKDAYTEVGYPEEWTFHHQGGSAGYKARESRASLECAGIVGVNQVCQHSL